MLKVDVDAINEVDQNLRAAVRGIEHALEHLETELRLVELRWEGTSTAAFVAARTRWATDARAMRATLVSLAEVTAKTASIYEATEQAAASTWDS